MFNLSIYPYTCMHVLYVCTYVYIIYMYLCVGTYVHVDGYMCTCIVCVYLMVGSTLAGAFRETEIPEWKVALWLNDFACRRTKRGAVCESSCVCTPEMFSVRPLQMQAQQEESKGEEEEGEEGKGAERGAWDFTGLDYSAPTPSWAVFGSVEAGFNPSETR